MTPKEIRELSTGDLERRLQETYEEQRNLRFQHATRQLQNTARFKYVKQDIARLKTILRERQLAGVS